jgi:NADPH-dependent curcumin reductase
MKNRQIVLASRPHGEPTEANFRLIETDLPAPGANQMLLRTVYLSLDPYMRGRMSEGPSYAEPVAVGGVMVGEDVAQVVESNLPQFKPGDFVVTYQGWQEYSLSDGTDARKIDATQAPISYALGVLGMPGFTAYTGLLNIGEPKPGETLVVAAASGAVGSVVGQIGRIKGCRVIGIAGGPRKCAYVKDELGFDACIDHRAENFEAQLKAACPMGIDIYYENVGGEIFEAVFPLLNNFARVPVCGLIAHYSATELPHGPNRVPQLMAAVLTKRLRLQGFIVTDYAAQFPQFAKDVSGWLREGRITFREDITDGFENAPRELIGLLRGTNFGKKLIRVSPDPTRA